MDIICKKDHIFKNPNKLPLNELYFEYKTLTKTTKDDVSLEEMLAEGEKTGDVNKWKKCYQVKVEKKPALDKCWVQQEKRLVEFHPFYPQFDDKENKEFLEKNQEFLEILNHLVDCTYHQFWCHMVCEPRISFIIKHFLEHSVSPYAVPYLNGEFLKLYDKIYSRFASIYERMLKFNVSETEYMSEAVAMNFLRNNELLNVRTIFLFCFLYNHSKPELVRRLTDFYFSDKYRETNAKELMEMLVDIVQEFDKLDCLELLSTTNSGCSILRRIPDKFDPTWLEDTSSYILEMAASLHTFLSVYKPAVEIAFELELPHRLSHIYQKVYMQLYNVLENKGDIGYDWSRYEMLVNQWLALGRTEFLNLFYVFACYILDKILGFRDDRPEQEKYLEIYLGLVSAALDDDLFIRDYNKAHPVESQFQILIDNVADFDKTQTDYLLISLHDMIEESEDEDMEAESQNDVNPEGQQHVKSQKGYTDESNKESFPEELYESVYDTLTQYLDVQQLTTPVAGTSKPSESKNLPEPVFVALKQYAQLMKQWETNPNCWKFDSDTSWEEFEPVPGTSTQQNINKPSEDEIEQHIKAVLEMLPDLKSGFVLRCLELMDYRPEQVISKVLDNDLPYELLEIPRDTMPGPSSETQKKSAPKTIAYVGKKPDYKNANDLLDDKKEKQDIKNLVLKASYNYDLDDDYDDRNEVYGTFEREDESKIYRHLKQPVPEYNVISDPSSSSDDEESNQGKAESEKSRNAFCEDPAVIRARREAQRGRVFRPPSRDVTGRPKGEGQDKNVQQNRDKKNVHKSSRANHNRKGGSTWKRSRGMIPS